MDHPNWRTVPKLRRHNRFPVLYTQELQFIDKNFLILLSVLQQIFRLLEKSLHEKSPYLEFFWFEYGKTRIREIANTGTFHVGEVILLEKFI